MRSIVEKANESEIDLILGSAGCAVVSITRTLRVARLFVIGLVGLFLTNPLSEIESVSLASISALAAKAV